MDKKLHTALLRIVDLNCSHASLHGLYYKDGQVYVCDAYLMAIVTTDYQPELENKIIGKKGEEITLPPMKFRDVFPESYFDDYEDRRVELDLPKIKTACELLSKDKKQVRALSLTNCHFHAKQMLLIIQLFETLKETPEIYIVETKYAIFRSEHCQALLIGGYMNYGIVLPLDEALTCGDLL